MGNLVGAGSGLIRAIVQLLLVLTMTLVLTLGATVLLGGAGHTPPSVDPPPAALPPASAVDPEIVQGPVLEDVPYTEFAVSSFNVLGNNHTLNGARGKAAGTDRIRWAVNLLRGHEVSVAGLQELQAPQLKEFRKVAPEFAAFPGARLGHLLTQNSIVWHTDVWRLERTGTTPIPYFHGQPVRMPHVLLRHRVTGQRVWFMNYHNPAQAHGPAGQWRRAATAIEGELASELMRSAPVVMTGDFNARADFFCQISRSAALHSADGGRRVRGTCRPPAQSRVDWILGSPEIIFSDYLADLSAAVKLTSDHPLVRATVRIHDRDS